MLVQCLASAANDDLSLKQHKNDGLHLGEVFIGLMLGQRHTRWPNIRTA